MALAEFGVGCNPSKPVEHNSISPTVVRGADMLKVIKETLWNSRNKIKNKASDNLEKPATVWWKVRKLEPCTALFGFRIKGVASGPSCTTAEKQHNSENSRQICQQNQRTAANALNIPFIHWQKVRTSQIFSLFSATQVCRSAQMAPLVNNCELGHLFCLQFV